MKSKGFTLIELLAVIVILAIIALIATPVILNLIEDSRKESNKISFDYYIDAINQAVARENLNENFNPSECSIENNELTCGEKIIKLDIDNKKNVTGHISFINNKIYYIVKMDGELLNNYCFVSTTEGEINDYVCEDNENPPIIHDLKLPIFKVKDVSFNLNKCIAFALGLGASKQDAVQVCNTQKANFDSFDKSTEEKMLTAVNSVTSDGIPYAIALDIVYEPVFSNFYEIEKIGSFAFLNNKINDLNISDTITHIKANSFVLSNIGSLTINDNITTVEDSSFINTTIENLTIGKSLETMSNAFNEETTIKNLTILDSVTHINECFSEFGLTSLKLSNSITEIPKECFGFNYLKSIEIPDSVTKIGTIAFYPNNITEVTIGSGVSDMGDAFLGSEKYGYGPNQIKKIIVRQKKAFLDISSFKIGWSSECASWTGDVKDNPCITWVNG